MTVYSDLNQFNPSTLGKEKLIDLESVNQSLINIFKTRTKTRLFNPEFGTEFEDFLFELIDETTALEVFRLTIGAVERFEPRVLIDFARTRVIPVPDEHRYDITLEFQIEGFGDQLFEFQTPLAA